MYGFSGRILEFNFEAGMYLQPISLYDNAET